MRPRRSALTLFLLLWLVSGCGGRPEPRVAFKLDVIDASTGSPVQALRLGVSWARATYLREGAAGEGFSLRPGRYTVEVKAPGYAAFRLSGLEVNVSRSLTVELYPAFYTGWPEEAPPARFALSQAAGRVRLEVHTDGALPLRAVTVRPGTAPLFGTPGGRSIEGTFWQAELSLSLEEVCGAGWLLAGVRDANGNQTWQAFSTVPSCGAGRGGSLSALTYKAVTPPRGPASVGLRWTGFADALKVFEDGFLVAALPASSTAFYALRSPGEAFCYRLASGRDAREVCGKSALPLAIDLRYPGEGARVPPSPRLGYAWSRAFTRGYLRLAVWMEGSGRPVETWEAPLQGPATPPKPLAPWARYYWGPVLAYAWEETPEGVRYAVAADESVDFDRYWPGPKRWFYVAP